MPIRVRRRKGEKAAGLIRHRRWHRARAHLRLLLVGQLVVVLAVGAGWLLLFSSVFTTEQVTVSGVTRISPVQVRHRARVPIGKQLARLDLAAIQARVENISGVEFAAVSRSWPHTVHIAVTERTPVAVVDRGTRLQQVDASGVLFGAVAHQPAGLPLIKAAPSIGAPALSEAAEVAASLPRPLARKVSYLQLRSPNDIVLLLRDGRTVVWGSAIDSDQKARVAVVFLRHKVQVVDVSVPGRPTTRG